MKKGVETYRRRKRKQEIENCIRPDLYDCRKVGISNCAIYPLVLPISQRKTLGIFVNQVSGFSISDSPQSVSINHTIEIPEI